MRVGPHPQHPSAHNTRAGDPAHAPYALRPNAHKRHLKNKENPNPEPGT
jgi:hypothetical protein